MTALQIACRRCAAQAGAPCEVMEDGKEPTAIHLVTGFHAERLEDAAACSYVADPVSVEEFSRAVNI